MAFAAGKAPNSTERKVRSAFAFALACLAVIAVLSYLSVFRLSDSARWVAHTDEVIGRLQSLLSTAMDAESAERGYVITGDESYLEPYQQALPLIDAQYQQLRQATADNPPQQRRLDALDPLLKQRMGELRAVIELRRTQGFAAAQARILSGQSRPLQDALRRVIDEMTAAEQLLLAERERRTARSALLTRGTLLVGGMLAFIFVAFSLAAIRRDFAGRYSAERALQAANEQLEARVQERTAALAQANDSLSQSERRFRAFVSATSDVVYRMSPDWSEMRYLQGRDFIADTPDPSGNWLQKYIHPDDQAHVTATIQEAIRSRSIFQLEHRVFRVDGTLGWTASRAIPLIEANGAISEWFGAASDVTERKLAQIRLQAQLARINLLREITRAIAERQDVQSIFQVVIRRLEEHLPVNFCCICLYEPRRRQLTVASVGVQSAALAMQLAGNERTRVGVDENGLGSCVRGQLVHEPDLLKVSFPFSQRLARDGMRSMVAVPLAAEGKVFAVLITARREPNGYDSGDCEFLQQLSEHVGLAAQQADLHQALQRAYDDLKQTQQAALQQERLLALGKMASGVAHDINNAISPIALYTDSMLERETGLSATARANLEVIQRAIEDVARTVARMREFYRHRDPQQRLLPVDLNGAVHHAIDLTRARWKDIAEQRGVAIDLRTELASDLPPIAAIENELRDALTNLIFNGVDAMPEGGALWLRTRLLRSAGAPDGPAHPLVQLEVEDTGVGMDEETRRRCLEPFFTTKGARGTGLGLAMVYGMAQRHGADLDIHSTLAVGTTIRLSFAVVSGAVSQPVALERPPPSPMRILLVDDDPLVLHSLRATLEADGHHVVTTDGGQAGIDAFARAAAAGEHFDVVITDLGMPQVDGRKVAAAVKGTRSDTLVLLLTGWGQRLSDDEVTPPNVDRVLSKPPRLRELREALALQLGSAKP